VSSVSLPARPQQVVRGVLLIVAAMFVTSVQDVVFKVFSTTLPLGQIFALRALLALPLLFALAWVQGIGGSVLAHALGTWPLLRSLLMTLMFLAFYAAIPFVNLSVLGAGTYTAPIFVTLLSAYAIGEPVGVRGWIAVLVGFSGVLVLLQPGTEAFSPWALLPVIGATFYALAHVTTRAKCQSVPLAAMVTIHQGDRRDLRRCRQGAVEHRADLLRPGRLDIALPDHSGGKAGLRLDRRQVAADLLDDRAVDDLGLVPDQLLGDRTGGLVDEGEDEAARGQHQGNRRQRDDHTDRDPVPSGSARASGYLKRHRGTAERFWRLAGWYTTQSSFIHQGIHAASYIGIHFV